MKMLLVSEEGIAGAVADSMKNYFDNPDVEVITFDAANHNSAVARLEEVVKANRYGQLLVLADVYGSVAYVETRIALEKFGVKDDNALIICGMSLPMAVKLHNVKDIVSVKYIRQVYERHNRLGYDLPLRKAG